jgi:hypothetical protein
MKLNGWHRLWVLLSAVYFILVTSYVILTFPKAESIPHQSEFYKKLSQKSAGMIVDTVVPGLIDPFVIKVEMPNNHTIEFKGGLSKKDMETASEEYWRIVEQKATHKRQSLLFYAFLSWIFLCLAFYALGWSINWVYKGFKQKGNEQLSDKNKILSDDDLEEIARKADSASRVGWGGSEYWSSLKMMRRLKDSIIEFDKHTSLYSIVLIIFTIFMTVMVGIQIWLALKK